MKASSPPQSCACPIGQSAGRTPAARGDRTRCARRAGAIWVWVLMAPWLMGCLSFRSITATASVGQLIGPRASAMTLLPLFCESENILAGSAPASAPSCPQAQIERESKEIVRYSQQVSAYASMLRDIAEFDDNRLADPLERAVRGVDAFLGPDGLGADVAAPAGMAVSASRVASLLSQEWRRNRLEELIRVTHEPLNAVMDGLVARTAVLSESTKQQAERELQIRRRMLDEIEREPLQGDAKQLATWKVQRQALRLGLLHFGHFARRANEALLEYKKALVAFQRAHQVLYERVSQNRSLLEDDARVYEVLKKDIPPLLK